MERKAKEEAVQAYAQIFKDSTVGFLVDYRGMDVESVTLLRRKLNEAKTGMKVLKNRMAKIAVTGTPFESLKDKMIQTRALVFGKDPVGPAKVVVKFEKDNEKFKVVAGVLLTGTSPTVLDVNRVKALATLPSREELLVKLMFVMNAQQTMFVRTLNEVPAKFARALAAVRDQKAKSA